MRKPAQPGQFLLNRPAFGEGGLKAALFRVDHGEAGVGGEGGGGKGMAGKIPGDVAGAGLLVGAQNAAAVGFQRDAQILYCLHGQQGGGQRPLVVVGAAAVDHAVHHFGGKGLGDGPAVAGGHHIQMAQNVEGVLPVIQVSGAHIALVVGSDEAPFVGQLQRLVQSGGGAGAEGRAGGGLALHAVNAHQTAHSVSQHGLFVSEIRLDLFLIHNELSPLGIGLQADGPCGPRNRNTCSILIIRHVKCKGKEQDGKD